jgi:hypothetical protein
MFEGEPLPLDDRPPRAIEGRMIQAFNHLVEMWREA